MPKNIEASDLGSLWTQLSVPIAGDPRNAADIEAIAQRLLDNDNYLAQELDSASLLDRLTAVDGAGSGLDADLLDGSHGSVFARKDGVLQDNLNTELFEGSDSRAFLKNGRFWGGTSSRETMLFGNAQPRSTGGAFSVPFDSWSGTRLAAGHWRIDKAGADNAYDVLCFPQGGHSGFGSRLGSYETWIESEFFEVKTYNPDNVLADIDVEWIYISHNPGSVVSGL